MTSARSWPTTEAILEVELPALAASLGFAPSRVSPFGRYHRAWCFARCGWASPTEILVFRARRRPASVLTVDLFASEQAERALVTGGLVGNAGGTNLFDIQAYAGAPISTLLPKVIPIGAAANLASVLTRLRSELEAVNVSAWHRLSGPPSPQGGA